MKDSSFVRGGSARDIGRRFRHPPPPRLATRVGRMPGLVRRSRNALARCRGCPCLRVERQETWVRIVRGARYVRHEGQDEVQMRSRRSEALSQH
ncbi:hypothetical protein L227DRAFT_230736 [Lentinus tigrinus ALCF2SS1-6]|uniref:Uncharacterized protein n=1 Tax=Lentinus tigrinus ALCF2SS1-6 TaxID=1328759 RepID=A0A5C2S1N0_9APHY|nr:hypothetical protein L227DRAFT_230736 [Lentinus tigrinus ALCF2SS1-6]